MCNIKQHSSKGNMPRREQTKASQKKLADSLGPNGRSVWQWTFQKKEIVYAEVQKHERA